MTEIEAKNAESAAAKSAFLRLICNPVPANIFMTSFSDIP
jgi:hypothetical protein